MNKQESQNQVSIIINGVRYDAVQTDSLEDTCNYCDLVDMCNEVTTYCCVQLLPKYYMLKKSDKKFEV